MQYNQEKDVLNGCMNCRLNGFLTKLHYSQLSGTASAF